MIYQTAERRSLFESLLMIQHYFILGKIEMNYRQLCNKIFNICQIIVKPISYSCYFRKSHHVVISPQRKNQILFIIPNIDKRTILSIWGTYIDKTLNWKPQILHINNKIWEKTGNTLQIAIPFKYWNTETSILFFNIPILAIWYANI